MKEEKRDGFSLSKSQEIGCEKIEKFLKIPIKENDPDTRVFVLKGKAGTGKTTLVKYALYELLKKDHPKDDSIGFDMFSIPHVLGVTMAHKAKNILKGSIPYTRTFASYFGLKKHHNIDGSISFKKDMKANPEEMLCNIPIDVIVHDESSMYDMEMIELVLKETNPISKIIFMGDPGQSPPINSINDEDSPVFNLFKNEHTLIERVRQTIGNPIIDLSDSIYNQIFGSQDLSMIYHLFKQEKIIDNKGFNTLFYTDFLENYKNSSLDYLDSKIVAYRNKNIDIFNSAIRGFIYDNPKDEFLKGEIISMNESYYHNPNKKGKFNFNDRSEEWICYNADEYKILEIEEGVIDGISVFKLYIDISNHPNFSSNQKPYIPVVKKEARLKFESIVQKLKEKAIFETDSKQKRIYWKFHYDFIEKFGDISYGYAYTTYKAQGSTFKNIYVNVNDIVTVGPLSPKRKLQALYTAITRASHLVTFLKTK